MGGREIQLVGIGATRGIASIAAHLILDPRKHGITSPLGAMMGNGSGPERASAQSIGQEH
jgi:hypothetical protein